MGATKHARPTWVSAIMTSSRPAALIVEDQPFVGLVASDILRESGFETFHAWDASDAAAVLEEHPEIEIVVTDAELSGSGEGIGLARRIANQRPDVQLVVTCASRNFSGYDIPDQVQLLHKPYASYELRRLVAAKSMLATA